MFAKLIWLFNRWNRMIHPYEEWYRIKQLIQNRLLDRFIKTRKEQRDTKFELERDLIEVLFSDIALGYNFYCRDAYQIFEQEVPTDYMEWRKDPKNHIESPISFKEKIPFKDFQSVGEIKYVFELNRLHVLPSIAYAYQQSRESSSLALFEEIILSWEKENPYLNSVNWVSGIEIGIRHFNLIIARLLVEKHGPVSQEISNSMQRLLDHGDHFLKRHLSLYSSANNHLLVELFGLVIYRIFNKNRDQEELVYYYNYFQEEVLKQTFPDGGSKEQATHYQAAVLNSAMVLLYLTARIGISSKTAFVERVFWMLHFLDLSTQGGNPAAHIGDKDDSNLLFDVFDPDFNLYQSLLASGYKMFPNIDFTYFESSYYYTDFINGLLYNNIQFTSPSLDNEWIEKNENYIYFKASGYFILHEEERFLCFDVGNLGFQPIAAHGHSDLLHFTYWINGKPIIVDSGTYQYQPDQKNWRDYFKGIHAHNTISFNGKDHALNLGTMIWGKEPFIEVEEYGANKERKAFCKALHKAFREGTHSRTIQQAEEGIIITDQINCHTVTELSFNLHFHPTVNATLSNDQLHLETDGEYIVIENEYFKQASLIKGRKEPPLGWYSNQYDQLIPTYCLTFSVSVKENIILKTLIYK